MAERNEPRPPNGYEKTYQAVAARLRDLEFPYAAKRLGFDLIDKYTMSIDFLGRTYALDRGGARPLDGAEADVNVLSVLAYYAVSGGSAEPSGDFALLNTFAGGLISGGDAAWMTAPLLKVYGTHETFRRAARDLGMIYEGSRAAGEHAWQRRLLPKIPARVKYFEADEEFPCNIKIYYDKTVTEFLDFEPLAVLTNCFVAALAAAARR
jgi:hypothetical protein